MYPGRDGHTRVAKVACGVKTVVRPINRLVSFELIANQLFRNTLGLPPSVGRGNVKKTEHELACARIERAHA